MIKVKFWTYVQNGGDGSCFIKFFSSKKVAEEYASYDDERMCDDINQHELEFDLDGNLITPDPEVDTWTKQWAAEKREKAEKVRLKYEKQLKEMQENELTWQQKQIKTKK